MIKIVAFILLLISSIRLEAQNTSYNFWIHGKVENLTNGVVKIAYIGKQGKYIEDTSKIINNSFEFKGFIDHPVSAEISGGVEFNNKNISTIFIEPAIMQISLSNDFTTFCNVVGSNLQIEYENFNYDPTTRNLERRIDSFKNLTKIDPLNIETKDSLDHLRKLIDPIYQQKRADQLKYIKNNPCSYLTVYMFRTLINRYSLDSIKHLYNKLCPDVKNTIYARRIEESIRSIEGGSPGTFAKNFSTVDKNGHKISLESFKGKKFVLLDFWATWCKPCREEAPFLNKLYDNFKDKDFEIISIANDDDRIELWKKVIDEDKINRWVHVLQGVNTQADIGKQYGVQPIPTKILIDKTGKILLRDESMSNIDFFKAMKYFIDKSN